jgi:hypothetical protein
MSQSENGKWVHGDELMEKWKVDEDELVRLCNEGKLPLYSAHNFEAMGTITNPVFIRHNHGSLKNFFKSHWFSLEDIERIEREQKAKVPIKKLRPNQRHKEAVRDAAKKLWKINPKITIEKMASRIEIKKVCEGRDYTPKTIRTWTKDLCPDNRPGRRPKAKIFKI